METENTVVFRLKSVKPEKIVPNFIDWLSQAGKVEFGESIPIEENHFRFGGEPGIRSGIKVAVILEGRQIGELECCINPPGVAYTGERPMDIPIKMEGQFRNVKSISISLAYNHPSARSVGRSDRWPIPFP